MHLILSHNTEKVSRFGNGEFINGFPFIRGSVESAGNEFYESFQNAFSKKEASLNFVGYIFDVSDFYIQSSDGGIEYVPPKIMTTDEWFLDTE